MMDKRHYDKGFTLLESMLVMAILSVFLLSGSLATDMFLYRDTQSNLVHTQTSALFRRVSGVVTLDNRIERYDEVKFNAKGNSSIAQTLLFADGKKIVIMLGPGRIHE
jgi:prepilin-type N-terminal cleavage/methylation domain-containing protein